MGFLKQAANEEEPDENDSNEELYEKMFPKIGRDFIYKEDLAKTLDVIFSIIDPLGLLTPDFRDDSEARKQALEYKKLLDKGKNGSKKYKDLINLDE
jgi:hypothetical protein